jgi:hypothetical protein
MKMSSAPGDTRAGYLHVGLIHKYGEPKSGISPIKKSLSGLKVVPHTHLVQTPSVMPIYFFPPKSVIPRLSVYSEISRTGTGTILAVALLSLFSKI